jgi:glycosyltransferase involved in cell wall biosynthesis
VHDGLVPAAARLQARKVAFDARQVRDVLAEHVAFRRHGGDLGGVLAAYGRHHRQRAATVRWAMSDLHTVVITAHNHGRFLPSAMESVLRQDWRPLEVIVVDDASRDDTPQVLAGALRDVPEGVHLRILRNRRSLGQTGSINLATLAARGSVLTMVDADDYLLAGTVPLARQLLHDHQAYLFGGAPRMFWGDIPQPSELELPAGDLPVEEFLPSRIFAEPTAMNISHTGSTFLRPAWHAVAGYRRIARTRITISPDREFHLRIASLLKVVETSVVVSHWRMGSSVNVGTFR